MPAPIESDVPPCLRVRVPASTSNLGPGFDQLGLALEMYLEVRLHGPIAAPEHALGPLGGTACEWPTAANRLLAAFDARLGPEASRARRFRFQVHSEIPLCRGLGSSGAAVAAGLLLADAWCARSGQGPRATDRRRLVELGLALEGHPDNVTASLLGGCTLAVPLPGGGLKVVEQALHRDFVFSVVWPSASLPTERARAALPSTLTLEDVVWNTRRLSLLLEGLRSGEPELLRLGSEDRLHTPHRLPLIPGAARALEAALAAGAWMSAISGSGSGLIALQDDEHRAREIAAAMATELERENEWVEVRCLRAARVGAQLVPGSSSDI